MLQDKEEKKTKKKATKQIKKVKLIMIQIHDIADSYTILLWIMITWRTAAETVVLCIDAATLITIADGSQSTNKKK
jgi:hypothetical protein